MCIDGKVGLGRRVAEREKRDGSNTVASSHTGCCLVALGVSVG